MTEQIDQLTTALLTELAGLDLAERVRVLNTIRTRLHEAGPFGAEPVDLVTWVPADSVTANDYNPNTVAPPEMRLLEVSITADGYTQPIVTHAVESSYEVVDGFHRNRVGKESATVRGRVLGYLPVVQIRASQADKSARMASTVRHNRARGAHGVIAMTDLVAYLAKRGWDTPKIMRELGMDEDEVLRFRQISGFAELFADQAFSEAWGLQEADE
jgi:ParB-like chromosome segregation protein Spo0J